MKALYDFVVQEIKQYVHTIGVQKRVITELQTVFKIQFQVKEILEENPIINKQLIDLPLQSLLNTQSNKFEDFAWRCIIVNLLLNKNLKKYFEEERFTLVKAVKNIRYNDQKKVVSIKLLDFMKKIVRFMSNMLDQKSS